MALIGDSASQLESAGASRLGKGVPGAVGAVMTRAYPGVDALVRWMRAWELGAWLERDGGIR